MNGCRRSRELFGAYWDDEITRAERDWLDAHFAACAACRAEYEAMTRTLTALAALPRAEAAPGLAERALVAARQSRPAPDRLFVRPTPAWVPAAAAAALVLVAAVALAPWLTRSLGRDRVALDARPVAEPRLVAVATPAGAPAAPASRTTISDTLFDHTEDVDFVLEPVTLHRGRARAASRLPQGVKAEQAIISF